MAKPIVKVIAATLAGTLLGCGERWMAVTGNAGRAGRATSAECATPTESATQEVQAESAPGVTVADSNPSSQPSKPVPTKAVPTQPQISSVTEKQPATMPTENGAGSKADMPDLPVRAPALSEASAQERTSTGDELASTNVNESPGPLPGIEPGRKGQSRDGLSPSLLPENGSYVVRPGDQLEITYSESWSVGRDYLLLPGDEIRVELLNSGDATGGGRSAGIDRTVLIQPDGKISLPYVGVVDAANHNVAELAKNLGDRYRTMYVDPEVLVTLVSTGELLRDIRAAFRTAGNRTTQVAQNGMVALPQLGSFKAAGLQLAEIQDEINERYRRALPGFGVMVRVADR